MGTRGLAAWSVDLSKVVSHDLNDDSDQKADSGADELFVGAGFP